MNGLIRNALCAAAVIATLVYVSMAESPRPIGGAPDPNPMRVNPETFDGHEAGLPAKNS